MADSAEIREEHEGSEGLGVEVEEFEIVDDIDRPWKPLSIRVRTKSLSLGNAAWQAERGDAGRLVVHAVGDSLRLVWLCGVVRAAW
jgi:hypothetical protein